MLWIVAYLFGAAVTGAWSIGIAGTGSDLADRCAIAALILFWPLAWLFAAGMAIANWQEL